MLRVVLIEVLNDPSDDPSIVVEVEDWLVVGAVVEVVDDEVVVDVSIRVEVVVVVVVEANVVVDVDDTIVDVVVEVVVDVVLLVEVVVEVVEDVVVGVVVGIDLFRVKNYQYHTFLKTTLILTLVLLFWHISVNRQSLPYDLSSQSRQGIEVHFSSRHNHSLLPNWSTQTRFPFSSYKNIKIRSTFHQFKLLPCVERDKYYHHSSRHFSHCMPSWFDRTDSLGFLYPAQYTDRLSAHSNSFPPLFPVLIL